MSSRIFPTELDVRGVSAVGAGIKYTEANAAQHFKALSGYNYVFSGLAASDGGGNTLAVATGVAHIGGLTVEITVSETVAIPDATRHVWIELTKNGSGKVTGHQLTLTATNVAPSADSVRIATVVAAGGDITTVTDVREWGPPRVIQDAYSGNDATSDRTITLGFRPKFVSIDATDGSTRIHATSGNDLGSSAVGCYVAGAEDTELATFVLSRSTRFRPEITATGFKVKHGTSSPPSGSLNKDSVTYRYTVWV